MKYLKPKVFQRLSKLFLKCLIPLGQGFDRHLLGLRLTAERLQMEEPALFRDTMYARMCHFILSTSTLSTDTIVFGGFGPVVDDGFGIGYNVVESKLGAVVASYKVGDVKIVGHSVA